MSAPRAYFVYGTLRPGGRYWVNVAAFVAGYEPAYIDGFALYDLPDGYPAIDHGLDKVFGDLLYIETASREKARRVIDEIEGYRLDEEESLFERVAVEAHRLRRPGARPVPADTNVYSPRRLRELRAAGTLIESGDWRQYRALRELGG